MNQKYTLHIADLQVSVTTDASPDEVDRISGILDRRMREIYLKSRCPKTQAALVCALDAIAERLGQQAELAELEERCEKYAIVLDSLKERNENQMAELERLSQENEVLRSLIANGGAQEAPIAPDPISPTDFFSEVAHAQTNTAADAEETAMAEDAAETVETVDIVEAEALPVEEAAPAESPRSRSRVGSMFDLLSFDEVD